jgi:hypothetical protein
VEETWLSRSFVAVHDGEVAGYIIAWFLRGEVHVLNVAVTAKYSAPGHRAPLARDRAG